MVLRFDPEPVAA